MEICFTLSKRIFSQRYLNKLQCKNVTFPNFHLFHRYLSVYNSNFLVYPHPNVSPLLCRNTDILFSRINSPPQKKRRPLPLFLSLSFFYDLGLLYPGAPLFSRPLAIYLDKSVLRFLLCRGSSAWLRP